MLDQIYEVTSVRQFLLETGARRLNAEDGDLPQHLQGRAGENWLLPVNWKHANQIVVRMGDTYPDDPPSLYLSRSKNPRDILPHVSQSGLICTMIDDQVINPDIPRDVLLACLEIAEKLLDRPWTDAEITAEINDELSAYWDPSAEVTLLFKRDDLDSNVLEIANPGKNNLSDVSVANSNKFKLPARLGMVAELEVSQTLNFLRSPGGYLATSHSFRASVQSFCEQVHERTRSHKTIDLFVFLIVKLGDQGCVLAGLIPQGIKSRGKTADELRQAIIGVLLNKGLRPYKAEDVSTRRLLRRTMGPHYDGAILSRRVAIIGCGSLGSMVADGLARCGIRSFFLCDSELLKPENLLRHHLSKSYLGFAKVSGLKVAIQHRIPDADVVISTDDIRTKAATTALTKFQPDLVFFATGDTNTDMTMSRMLPMVCPATLVFGWAEQDLAAGHLVYQPPTAPSILRDLHDEKTGCYVHSVTKEPVMYRESGCQSSYSPYSGLAMGQFAIQVAMKIIDWLEIPSKDLQVLKVCPNGTWENVQ